MEITKIIKYEGNERYFIGLFKLKDNKNNEKFCVIYALTDPLSMSSEIEDNPENLYDFNCHFNIIQNRIYKVIIPFKIKENGNSFTMICIEDEKDYNLIKTVVESFT